MASKPSTPATAPAEKATLLGGGITATPVGHASERGNPRQMGTVVENWGDDGSAGVSSGTLGLQVVEMNDHGEAPSPETRSKSEQVMEILRTKRPGDANPEATDDAGAKTGPKIAETAVIEPEKASRKDALKALETEKAHRKLEKELKETRERLGITERAFKEGKLSEIIKARGLSPEQAILEALGEEPTPKVATPSDEVAALKAKVEAMEAEATRATRQQQEIIIRQTVNTVLEPLDLPLTKAVKRIPVPQADGSARFMEPFELIMAVAEQQWKDAGSVPGTERNYLATAAQNVEDTLAEENGPLIEAARGPKPKAEAKPAVPALGRRAVPAAGKGDDRFSQFTDEDERRQAIRRATFGN
jgi:hypothetical protein